MKKLYEKNELWFALVWIILYCVITGTIRGNFGDASPLMLADLAVFSAAIMLFVKKNHLEGKYGLDAWPRDWKRYLYFIPMWILTTGNLWGGVQANYSGISLVCAVLSMLLVGFVEEMIFRGFLFNAMLPKDGVKVSIIVSALTFGMGHIINLFTGQAGIHTIIQIFFAAAWGFILTLVYYKSGSLLPSILAHSLVDAFSCFSVDNPAADNIYVASTILISLVYCLWLSRK